MKYINLTLRLEEKLHEAVTDEAWKTRRSMNKLINDILTAYFEKKIHENT